MDYLLELGVRVDEEDLYGQTPIYYVASENRLNIVDRFTDKSKKKIMKIF